MENDLLLIITTGGTLDKSAARPAHDVPAATIASFSSCLRTAWT